MKPAPQAPKDSLDARGLSCPLPLLKTRQALRRLGTGEILHVVASDSGSRRDIPAWLRQSEHDLVHFTGDGEEIHFWIRRGCEREASC